MLQATVAGSGWADLVTSVSLLVPYDTYITLNAPLRICAGCMNRAKDLIDYLREEPEEQAWATAGPKKDKSHDNRASAFGNSIKPQALLERFYSEGKILPGHLDER